MVPSTKQRGWFTQHNPDLNSEFQPDLSHKRKRDADDDAVSEFKLPKIVDRNGPLSLDVGNARRSLDRKASFGTKQYIQREELVAGLPDKLVEYRHIQVSGTPSSGKTTLAKLFHNYISKREPDTLVVLVSSRKADETAHGQPRRTWLAEVKGYNPHDEEPVLIIDEARESFWDFDFWLSIRNRNLTRVVTLASQTYGSTGTDHTRSHSASVASASFVTFKRSSSRYRTPEARYRRSPMGTPGERQEKDKTLKNFTLAVSLKMLPINLGVGRGSGDSVERPPGAQYRDKFYQTCAAYTNDCITSFPEFGSKNGRFDFIIPSRKLPVLLRGSTRIGRWREPWMTTLCLIFEVQCLCDLVILKAFTT